MGPDRRVAGAVAVVLQAPVQNAPAAIAQDDSRVASRRRSRARVAHASRARAPVPGWCFVRRRRRRLRPSARAAALGFAGRRRSPASAEAGDEERLVAVEHGERQEDGDENPAFHDEWIYVRRDRIEPVAAERAAAREPRRPSQTPRRTP